jgi:hypothetical protein
MNHNPPQPHPMPKDLATWFVYYCIEKRKKNYPGQYLLEGDNVFFLSCALFVVYYLDIGIDTQLPFESQNWPFTLVD